MKIIKEKIYFFQLWYIFIQYSKNKFKNEGIGCCFKSILLPCWYHKYELVTLQGVFFIYPDSIKLKLGDFNQLRLNGMHIIWGLFFQGTLVSTAGQF